MTYSDAGSGYGQPVQPSGGSDSRGLSFYLGLGVAALGVVIFLLGFAPYLSSDSSAMMYGLTLNAFEMNGIVPLVFLLFGGLLSGISLLPKQSYSGPAAAAAVVGFLTAFAVMLNLPGGAELGAGGIAILVLGFVQAVLATAVFLFGAGIVKEPTGRPSRTHVHPAAYGHPQGYAPQQGYGPPQGYGPQQGYPQMPGYGQPQPNAPQQYGYQQSHQAPQPTAGYGQFQAGQPYQAQQPTQQMSAQQQQQSQPSAQPQPQPQSPAQPEPPQGDTSSAPTQAFGAQTEKKDDEK
ncbi:hypothetical protein C8K36_102373 [Rhodococcus sp. OK519]|uniref:DUF5336 domain-containing protein n=1 Tax=Rhodococcus sp. OK519 TaxID=2135729 RepID=UPI000D3D28E9|nr:hypothetical protein C8K36_102373 [Rhodococcus sp. OK519]